MKAAKKTRKAATVRAAPAGAATKKTARVGAAKKTARAVTGAVKKKTSARAATGAVKKKASARAGAKKKATERAAASKTARVTSGAVTKSTGAPVGASASDLISGRIAELNDWRGAALAKVRELIRKADPDVVEEWKWRGTPVWAHDGGVCTGEVYRAAVKLTFFRGAALADPTKLFNSSLEGNTRRAIDIQQGAKLNEKAFVALFREAVALNASKGAKKKGADR